MGDSDKRFPTIGTEIVIKFDNDATDLVDRFPDMEQGDIFQITDHDLSDVNVGQFLLISKVPAAESEFSVLVADETTVMDSSANELGARVSQVDDVGVTLEVISSLEDGGRG
jgi:hypothetical protein